MLTNSISKDYNFFLEDDIIKFFEMKNGPDTIEELYEYMGGEIKDLENIQSKSEFFIEKSFAN